MISPATALAALSSPMKPDASDHPGIRTGRPRDRTARQLIGAAALVVAVGMISSASAASLSGVVQSGGTAARQPLGNVKVSLLEATTAAPTLLGEATTNAAGQFAITFPRDTSSSVFYLSADLGGRVEFVAVLGPKLPPVATVNELTTVATSYAMAQFYRTGMIAGDSFALRLAAGMNNNLVSVATGESSPVMLTSPNADETDSLRTTRALANLLAACVANDKVALAFLKLTKPARGPTFRTTAAAMAALARIPATASRWFTRYET